jgi:aminoglycoside phosphotransferase family enzyme
MNLIEAFENKLVKPSMPELTKTLETVISKLFFYEDTVIKIYNYKESFFGDFGDPKLRKDFYQKDFSWNNLMSPAIYLQLVGMKKVGDMWEEVDLEKAEDYYIKMKKIDDSLNVTNLMVMGKMTDQNYVDLGHKMTARLQLLTKEKWHEIRHLFEKDWKTTLLDSMEETIKWCYMAENKMSKELTDRFSETIQNTVKTYGYFQDPNNFTLQASTDNHTDNILILDGKVEFIDAMPPKESWKVYESFYNICRPATDVAVISGRTKADLMYEEYKKVHDDTPPETVKAVYEIENALIKGAYLYMTDREVLADKFINFIEERIKDLN